LVDYKDQHVFSPEQLHWSSISKTTLSPEQLHWSSINKTTLSPEQLHWSSINKSTLSPEQLHWSSINKTTLRTVIAPWSKNQDANTLKLDDWERKQLVLIADRCYYWLVPLGWTLLYV